MPQTEQQKAEKKERERLRRKEKKEQEQKLQQIKQCAKERQQKFRDRKKEQEQRERANMSGIDDEKPPKPVETPVGLSSRALLDDEPPPVETPLAAERLVLSTIDEDSTNLVASLNPSHTRLLTPAQIAALERSRQRQQQTANNSINRTYDIYAAENAAEERFQQRVIYGVVLEDKFEEGLPANSAPPAIASAATGTPTGLSRNTTPKKFALLEDAGSKMPVVPPTSVSRKRKGTTPSDVSRKRKSAPATPQPAAKRHSKPKSSSKRAVKPIPLPVIDLTFAMIAREWYKGQKNVLAIGQGAGTWDFDLPTHLTTIQQKNPEKDFYLVGYRNEERPVIPSIHEYKRIHVPFFVVHALPQGVAPPNRVTVSDLEAKTLEYHALVNLPLKWVKVTTFFTGQEVHMFVSTARTTSRALASQTSVCSGGQFWFSIPIDYNDNPGDDFIFVFEDDKFYFAEDAWYETRAELKSVLRQDDVVWVDFCRWDEQRWLDLVLPVAVNKFFEYEDDLPQDECEPEVKKLPADTFRSFKKKREAEEDLYEEHREVAENSKHFKIYPENECLKGYLTGDCLKISKWCGNAEAVYLHVQPPPSANEPACDLWGNLLLADS